MRYIDKVKISTDIEWLREELQKSQNLNKELHRRLQKCEGADTRLEILKDRIKHLERQLFDSIEFYKNYSSRVEGEFQKKFWKLWYKIEALPWIIRKTFGLDFATYCCIK